MQRSTKLRKKFHKTLTSTAFGFYDVLLGGFGGVGTYFRHSVETNVGRFQFASVSEQESSLRSSDYPCAI